MGDIDGLAESIERLGLLQPIGITPDNVLIFGARRLIACKQLGWDRLACTVIKMDDIVDGEYDENVLRKDFTLSERHEIEQAMPKKSRGGDQSQSQNFANADEAAKSAGLGNRETAKQVGVTVDKGTPELVAAMNAGEVAPSVAAKVATLSKREQKAAVAGGKNAMREAAKIAASPNIPMPPEYPLSDQYVKWIESLGALAFTIDQEHGGILKLVKKRDWDQKRTSHFAEQIKSVAKAVNALNKELSSVAR